MEKEFLMGLMEMPEEVAEAILQKHTAEMEQAAAAHEAATGKLRLEGMVQAAIAREKGKNAKAITALLDMDALEADEAAVNGAVQALKKACGYLFEEAMPPLYAAGTGAVAPKLRGPGSLAEALRERFERK